MPVAAVSLNGAGETVVTVRQSERNRQVPVETGASGDGFVEVVPAEGSRLRPGDLVVVGIESRS
ncbi:hypothetical protein [Nocardioides dubius]|uniref:hypothetical protein n=1 Tax=Nocardioides dubius TaxID=317019 RepID=UPI0031E01F7D